MTRLDEIRQERYIPLVATGKDSISLQGLNEVIHQIFTSIQLLEGRNGPIQLHDQIQMDGGIVSNQSIEDADADYMVDINGTLSAVPIVGQWTMTGDDSGVGAYTWDTQIISDDLFFDTFAADTEIVLLKEGTYLILGQLAAEVNGAGLGVVSISLDGIVISTVTQNSLGASATTGFTISAIAQAEANSVVSAALTTGNTRLGDAIKSTLLTIYRLN